MKKCAKLEKAFKMNVKYEQIFQKSAKNFN